jgi:hypothetical protein
VLTDTAPCQGRGAFIHPGAPERHGSTSHVSAGPGCSGGQHTVVNEPPHPPAHATGGRIKMQRTTDPEHEDRRRPLNEAASHRVTAWTRIRSLLPGGGHPTRVSRGTLGTPSYCDVVGAAMPAAPPFEYRRDRSWS